MTKFIILLIAAVCLVQLSNGARFIRETPTTEEKKDELKETLTKLGDQVKTGFEEGVKTVGESIDKIDTEKFQEIANEAVKGITNFFQELSDKVKTAVNEQKEEKKEEAA